jgi:hypothetical protein
MSLYTEEILSIFAAIVNILRKQPGFNDEKFSEEIKTLLEDDKDMSKVQREVLFSLLNHSGGTECDATKENEPDEDDTKPDYDYSSDDVTDFYDQDYATSNDPLYGVDWGDPSTFTDAAWDQINDRD